jgi:uncharacterized protein (DUF885 family)
MRIHLFAMMLGTLACAPRSVPRAALDPGEAVTRLADEYVAAFFARSPEAATRRGVPEADHGRVIDNSLQAIARWQEREDAWLAQLRAIDPAPLAGRPEWQEYGILREVLEGSIVVRACRMELWDVSTAPSGWQAGYAALAGLQPVGSVELRAQAIARARALPRFVDTETDRLRLGLALGYSAPRVIVEGVIRQLDGLLATPPDSSPFASPALRDSTPGFRAELVRAIADELLPAIRRHRSFLAEEYLPRARPTIGVSAIRNGERCYRAAVRRFTTLDLPPEDIFRAGEREMAAITAETRVLLQRRFGSDDVAAGFRRLREDSGLTYGSRQQVIDVSSAAIERGRAAMARWFGIVPRAPVVVREHPEFRQREGAVAQYSGPPDDGSRPGIFWITTYRPDRIPRSYGEATAFHEGIPGHHLQVAIAVERTGVHPVTRHFGFSGFSEGWALYAERLADEMGLYSDDVARLGLLSSEAWRAARLVVDAGMHARGWTREQAVDYLTAHTAMSPLQVQGEVDRYISWPGQATAYMLGNLEIRALRREAERRLGARFDIRRFHDAVLGHGSVTLPMLRAQVEGWLQQEEAIAAPSSP